jgi:hypothetical protein
MFLTLQLVLIEQGGGANAHDNDRAVWSSVACTSLSRQLLDLRIHNLDWCSFYESTLSKIMKALFKQRHVISG